MAATPSRQRAPRDSAVRRCPAWAPKRRPAGLQGLWEWDRRRSTRRGEGRVVRPASGARWDEDRPRGARAGGGGRPGTPGGPRAMTGTYSNRPRCWARARSPRPIGADHLECGRAGVRWGRGGPPQSKHRGVGSRGERRRTLRWPVPRLARGAQRLEAVHLRTRSAGAARPDRRGACLRPRCGPPPAEVAAGSGGSHRAHPYPRVPDRGVGTGYGHMALRPSGGRDSPRWRGGPPPGCSAATTTAAKAPDR